MLPAQVSRDPQQQQQTALHHIQYIRSPRFFSWPSLIPGKTTVAMGLLHLFLKRGYKPSDLAYIKPCTQCEDVQIISKYCEKMGIQHQGIGPVIFVR